MAALDNVFDDDEEEEGRTVDEEGWWWWTALSDCLAEDDWVLFRYPTLFLPGPVAPPPAAVEVVVEVEVAGLEGLPSGSWEMLGAETPMWVDEAEARWTCLRRGDEI